jgi:hypothetical protein
MASSLFENEIGALDDTAVTAAALICAIDMLGSSQGIRVRRRAWPYQQRDVGLEDFEDETVRRLCRSDLFNSHAVRVTNCSDSFTKVELQLILPYFGFEDLEFKERVKPRPIIALMILCARLAYPDRWYHLPQYFGRSITWLSRVFTSSGAAY